MLCSRSRKCRKNVARDSSVKMTIPAGETVTTTFTFGERDLLFGCHLPGHYVYGMRGTIEVV